MLLIRYGVIGQTSVWVQDPPVLVNVLINSVWPTLLDVIRKRHVVLVELLPNLVNLLWSDKHPPNISLVSRDPLIVAKLIDDPDWEIWHHAHSMAYESPVVGQHV